MVTSRVLVEPNQFSSQISGDGLARVSGEEGEQFELLQTQGEFRVVQVAAACCGVDDEVAEVDRLVGDRGEGLAA
ncbi:hypothetical protein ACWCQN_39655 [Streptomyces sp. NPDC001984]